MRLLNQGVRKVVRNPGESFLMLRMAAWVSLLSMLVKLQPLPRALRIVAAGTQRASNRQRMKTEKTVARALDLLLGANLFVFRPICWKRAAILHRYLALNGINTQIVFGVRTAPDGAVEGHAWLEAGGKPILEARAPNYKVAYTFPSNDSFDLELSVLTKP